ncbi:MAG TPA: hypothetical protein DER40_09895 [Geobacter sp.]|nr:hypothetical protein [Geobacter sp.]HCE67806.1 hypothetical protein [Geobacter sp.]
MQSGLSLSGRGTMIHLRLSTAVIAVSAALICLLVYLPALDCGFVGYDDPDYVLNNPLIRQLDAHTIKSAFTEQYIGWWMPLTWISFAIDYHFWGLDPFGYHLTNILLHSINAGLVVLIAGSLTGREPWLAEQGRFPYLFMLLSAGLLWGLHPLRVESVAWVTERKDVLNGFFALASVAVYLRYAGRREERGAWPAYVCSLLLYACSLMSKSVSLVLPVLLLVIDWRHQGGIRPGRTMRLLVEKIPFMLLSAAIAVITIRSTAKAGYLISYSDFPFSQRLAVSGNAIFEYVRLMLFPLDILPFYLIPDPIPVSYALKTLLVVLAAILLFTLRKAYPWLPATLLCFLLPLLPVLAFFQNGDQSLAARFTYLPAIAPSIAVAFLPAFIFRKTWPGRWRQAGAGGFMIVLLLSHAFLTRGDIPVWHDSESLWTRVIEHRPEVASYKERGRLYAARGEYRAAVDDFSAAIAIADGVWQRRIFNLYAFRGEANRLMGHYPEAVQDFTAAISLYPHPAYYYHRGLALKQLGKLADAERDFARAGGAGVELGWYEGNEL